jgi:hypothetical protein
MKEFVYEVWASGVFVKEHFRSVEVVESDTASKSLEKAKRKLPPSGEMLDFHIRNFKQIT